MGVLTVRLDAVEIASGGKQPSVIAGECLPTTHDGVDIDRVDLQAEATPTGALRRDDGRATAEKRIEYNFAPARAVEHGVCHHGDRLDGRVQLREVAFFRA